MLLILGVCGTFMAGVARLAKLKGFEVLGFDSHAYPPMSTILERLEIPVLSDMDVILEKFPQIEHVVVGNTFSRGHPLLEHCLNSNISYSSGPQWLAEHVLSDRDVITVAGTHGKTSTTSMIMHILSECRLKPGYLIGGLPVGFDYSSDLGQGPFVLEGDEYDTAFDDKRAKFMHYHPNTLLINNIEYDHADIYDSIEAIYRQFHHLVRTVPGQGHIVIPEHDEHVKRVLEMGCWTPLCRVGGHSSDWQLGEYAPDGSEFEVFYQSKLIGTLNWALLGRPNMMNGLFSMAAACLQGVEPQEALRALQSFQGVKRRMELKGKVGGVSVYDDFAHHPTAIRYAIDALKNHTQKGRVIALLELGSYTLREQIHGDELFQSLSQADLVYLYSSDEKNHIQQLPTGYVRTHSVDALLDDLLAQLLPGDCILTMSSRDFAGIHNKILNSLAHGNDSDLNLS